MAKTVMVHARITQELKNEVEGILKDLGITATEAIRVYFTQIKLKKGLPFPVEMPNETTIKTFEKTDRGEELNSYGSVEDFFRKMDSHA